MDVCSIDVLHIAVHSVAYVVCSKTRTLEHSALKFRILEVILLASPTIRATVFSKQNTLRAKGDIYSPHFPSLICVKTRLLSPITDQSGELTDRKLFVRDRPVARRPISHSTDHAASSEICSDALTGTNLDANTAIASYPLINQKVT